MSTPPAPEAAPDLTRHPVIAEWLASPSPRKFWLDGGGARDWSGQRSILGVLADDDVSLTYSAARREVTRHVGGRAEVVGDDVFAVLEAELVAGGPRDQWFGYLGYACRPDLPARPSADVPDAVLMRPSRVRLVEHGVVGGSVSGAPGSPTPSGPFGPDPRLDGAPFVATSPLARSSREGRQTQPRSSGGAVEPAPGPGGPDGVGDPSASVVGAGGLVAGEGLVDDEYRVAFERVQERLHAGDSYEVNLTHRVRVESGLEPAAAYLRLRRLNPAPYAGFLQHDVPGARAWLLSSSPERFATITGDPRVLETKPIKGTTPRSDDPVVDAAHRERLASDPRYRAENLMIVDLLRHDVASVCEVGSVEVPQLMEVESYETVHQLVSTVRGRLRPEVSTVAALRALFPAGSMTGAPKLRTMEVVDEVEASPRGAYAGAFGWVSGDGRADLGVVIRSLVTAGDGRWTVGTGGGITVLSDVAEEHAEAALKARRLLEVFTPS
ncbi:unannotated protein [freshwater metagenome]|uniref:Unannotated protein n=1 Tax=freshwater metagenome TaxID=449393 RepID=A0A6J6SWI7_9ZZZZ